MRVALAQMNSVVGDLDGNLEKIKGFISRAKSLGADCVVFPEMALCGYPPEDLLYKRQFIKDIQKKLISLATVAKNIIVIAGYVHADVDKKIYNAAAVLANQKIQGIYLKQNLPNYGVFDERRYFDCGQGSPVFNFGLKKVGISICEDLWVEDGICQAQALRGAKVIINISASPYHVGKLSQRRRLLKKKASELGVNLVYVNMVGGQDEIVFDGGSFVVDPQGRIIAYGKQFEEDLFCVDLDVSDTRSEKKSLGSEFNIPMPSAVKEKSIISVVKNQQYSRLERIYQALVLGTRDYVRKNGFQKVLIGLSGGMDSSLVAAVAVEALGAENVVGVTMPSRYTSGDTRGDAKLLAQNLGIQCLEISIEGIFKSYLKELKKPFQGKDADTAEENIQARIRGNLLMALSNKFGWMVLTTGNKSEIAVGYCTLYGDMSGGFAVIKDVPKTKVYELAEFLNSRKKEWIPPSVIKRAPSAELRENQKDQDSLPPYDVLDAILERYIEQNQSFELLIIKFKPDIVRKVIQLVDANEYKRRQGPPGIKITPRAFGKDWRLPLTNRYKSFKG